MTPPEGTVREYLNRLGLYSGKAAVLENHVVYEQQTQLTHRKYTERDDCQWHCGFLQPCLIGGPYTFHASWQGFVFNIIRPKP